MIHAAAWLDGTPGGPEASCSAQGEPPHQSGLLRPGGGHQFYLAVPPSSPVAIFPAYRHTGQRKRPSTTAKPAHRRRRHQLKLERCDTISLDNLHFLFFFFFCNSEKLFVAPAAPLFYEQTNQDTLPDCAEMPIAVKNFRNQTSVLTS